MESTTSKLQMNARILAHSFVPSLLLIITCCQHNKACQHDKNTFRCVEYVKNYDGDTITVNIPGAHPLIGTEISVRINGIDTPELKTKDPCERDKAKVAQKRVEDLLRSARRIDLVNVKRDKYFRILADVVIDGETSVADQLKVATLGFDYDGGTKMRRNWCD